MESIALHILNLVLWSVGGGIFAVLVGLVVRKVQDNSTRVKFH
jgi:hypothetical protein